MAYSTSFFELLRPKAWAMEPDHELVSSVVVLVRISKLSRTALT